MARVVVEAAQLASKLRAIWRPRPRLSSGGSPPRGPFASPPTVAQAAARAAGGTPTDAAGASAASASSAVDTAEEDERDDGEESASGNEHEQSADEGVREHDHEHGHEHEHVHEGDEQGGLEAWERFMAELPRESVASIFGPAVDADGRPPAAQPTTFAAGDLSSSVLADRAYSLAYSVAALASDGEVAHAAADASDLAAAALVGAACAAACEAACEAAVRAVGGEAAGGASALDAKGSTGGDAALPLAGWPNEAVAVDVVKAWVLLEVAGFRAGQETDLLGRMSLSDKRVWLSRRLYREHHGGRVSEEDPLLFVECTRDDAPGAVLDELRAQFERGVGLGGELAATVEVHFKEENSAGSAVKREWFSLISEAFLSPAAGCAARGAQRVVRGGDRIHTGHRSHSRVDLVREDLGCALADQPATLSLACNTLTSLLHPH